jgi:hypothetical protein
MSSPEAIDCRVPDDSKRQCQRVRAARSVTIYKGADTWSGKYPWTELIASVWDLVDLPLATKALCNPVRLESDGKPRSEELSRCLC